MKKDEALKHWQQLEPDQDPTEYMTPLDPKSKGSSYGACGIRIDGNPKFIDAVLSRLQPLIKGENHVTRLALSRNQVDREFKPGLEKAEDNAEVCYIRLYLRGEQGAMASGFFDKHLAEATREYAKALRIEYSK